MFIAAITLMITAPAGNSCLVSPEHAVTHSWLTPTTPRTHRVKQPTALASATDSPIEASPVSTDVAAEPKMEIKPEAAHATDVKAVALDKAVESKAEGEQKVAQAGQDKPLFVQTHDTPQSLAARPLATQPFSAQLAGLLLLGALAAVAIWLKRKRSILDEDADFEVISSHAIAPKQKLLIVRIGQDRMVLGVSEKNIQLLSSSRQTSNDFAPVLAAVESERSSSGKDSPDTEGIIRLREAKMRREQGGAQ